MLASLIIATRNRCEALDGTLRAVNSIRVPRGMELEVLTVDNGSNDLTRACIENARVHGHRPIYIYEPESGKSNALNTAIAQARGDVLVFIDDDVRPRAEWLERIVSALTHADAVGGAVHIPAYLQRSWMTDAHRAWLASTHYIAADAPQTAVGANLAVHRHVFSKVPRFDPELGPGKLGLWEDTLFTMQLVEAGLRLKFEPQAVVEHHFAPNRLSRRAFLAHAINEGRSSAYVDWHWQHAIVAKTRHRALLYQMRLVAKRLLNPRSFLRVEGIAEWEMNLCCGIAYMRFLREQVNGPRMYSRHGTEKLPRSGSLAGCDLSPLHT